MKRFVGRQILPSLLGLVLLPTMVVAALLCVHVRVNGAGRELLPLTGPWLENGLALLQPVLFCFLAFLPLWGRRFLEQDHHRLTDLAALGAFLAGGLVEIDWFLATPGLLTAPARCWYPLPRPLLWAAFFLLLNSLLLTIHAVRAGRMENPSSSIFRVGLEVLVLLPVFLLIHFHPLHSLAVENPDPEQAVFIAETRILNALDRYRHFTGLAPESLEKLVDSGFMDRIPWNPWHPRGKWEVVRSRPGGISGVHSNNRRTADSLLVFQAVSRVQSRFRELLLGLVILLLIHHLLLMLRRLSSSRILRSLLLMTEISFLVTVLLLALGSRPLWVIMTGASWPVG